MSPANRAGSVSEISPCHSFRRKNLGNRDEHFSIWTLQPGDRDATFYTKKLSVRFRRKWAAKIAQFLSCMYFHFRSERLSSISKVTRITSWILPGPLLPWQPTFALACTTVVYINKFVAGHENLFYRKYSLEQKKRLITNVKRENDICLCTHFDNRIILRLGFHKNLPC